MRRFTPPPITNLTRIVETPIKLVSWDRIAELANRANNGSRDWVFFKADRESSYKQLPAGYSHAKIAVFAFRPPHVTASGEAL